MTTLAILFFLLKPQRSALFLLKSPKQTATGVENKWNVGVWKAAVLLSAMLILSRFRVELDRFNPIWDKIGHTGCFFCNSLSTKDRANPDCRQLCTGMADIKD